MLGESGRPLSEVAARLGRVPRGVSFEVILGVYAPAVMAALSSESPMAVSVAWSFVIELSDR